MATGAVVQCSSLEYHHRAQQSRHRSVLHHHRPQYSTASTASAAVDVYGSRSVLTDYSSEQSIASARSTRSSVCTQAPSNSECATTSKSAGLVGRGVKSVLGEISHCMLAMFRSLYRRRQQSSSRMTVAEDDEDYEGAPPEKQFRHHRRESASFATALDFDLAEPPPRPVMALAVTAEQLQRAAAGHRQYDRFVDALEERASTSGSPVRLVSTGARAFKSPLPPESPQENRRERWRVPSVRRHSRRSRRTPGGAVNAKGFAGLDGKENDADGLDLSAGAKAGRARGSNGSTNSSSSVTLAKSRSLDFSICDTIADVDFHAMVQVPDGVELNEWLATNSIAFFNHVNLLYGAVSDFCVVDTCPVMIGTGNQQYQWVDEKGKKCKCSAPQYVTYVMSFVERSAQSEDCFPTKYGNAFPTGFESLIRKVLRLLSHVLAHLHVAHSAQLAALGLGSQTAAVTVHLAAFTEAFSLLDAKEQLAVNVLVQRQRRFVLSSSGGGSGAQSAPLAVIQPQQEMMDYELPLSLVVEDVVLEQPQAMGLLDVVRDTSGEGREQREEGMDDAIVGELELNERSEMEGFEGEGERRCEGVSGVA